MNQTKERHPSGKQLADFANGTGDAPVRKWVEQHIETCESCCAALGQVPDDTVMAVVRKSDTATDGVVAAPPKPERRAKLDLTPPKELQEHPRYKIVKPLGAGGMGVVYLAQHRLMERPVALKVISRLLTRHPAAVERFLLEVKAAARLAHPNIVAAHDAERAGDLHFLVMEYVEGVSLAEVVARQGSLSVTQACNFARQAALGLQHASERGMVHRDIKPHNLMITKKGQVKILDFGLARFAREAATVELQIPADLLKTTMMILTQAGQVLGTPDYIAPEQVEKPHEADIRADIYSLGCTLFFMLTGKPPFADSSVTQKLNSHLDRQPPRIAELRRDLPPELIRILDRMMEKDPAHRYATPAELAKDLEPLARSKSTTNATVATADIATPLLRELLEDERAPVHHDVATQANSGYTVVPSVSIARSQRTQSLGGLRLSRRARRMIVTAPIVVVLLIAAITTIQSWLAKMPIASTATSGTTGGSSDAVPNTVGPNVDRASPVVVQSDGAPPTQTARENQSRDRVRSKAVTSEGGKPRCLFVLASRNFWYDDFEPVRQVLADAGIDVVVCSGTDRAIPMPADGNEKPIHVDVQIADARAGDYAAVIFCGGKGVWEFMDPTQRANEAQQLIRDALAQDKVVAAICMGPVILAKAGVLAGRKATGHSSVADKVREWNVTFTGAPVEVDKSIVTGRGPDAAAQFGRTIVKQLSNGSR